MLAKLAHEHGVRWTIENPLSSMLWIMPQTEQFCNEVQPIRVEFHMCAFGAQSMKPTLLLCSDNAFCGLARTCPGCSSKHKHVELQGWKWVNGKKVYLTKLAQVYPDAV